MNEISCENLVHNPTKMNKFKLNIIKKKIIYSIRAIQTLCTHILCLIMADFTKIFMFELYEII